MIILHAAIDHGQLLLWGEMPAEPGTRPPGQRGGKARGALPSDRTCPPLLPYDAGAEGLSAALKEARFGLPPGRGRTEEVIAWLPTVDRTPVASSPLIAEPSQSPAKTILAPWTVTALRLSTEQAVELLCACIGRQTLASGVIVGEDLKFWAATMQFAGAIVARQQFLPDVAHVEPPHLVALPQGRAKGPYGARWTPVFAGTDADRLAKLAKAMPHACRALTAVGTTFNPTAPAPPQVPSAAVITNFVGGIVDHLVRSSIAPGQVGFPSKKASSFDSLHDQWLHALRAPDGAMAGDETELARFADQMRQWRRPISVAMASPFRLCFRLEEPASNGDGVANSQRGRGAWHIRYLLQAVDDPSLLIPATDAWRAKGRGASILARGGFNAREYLLSSLGQAAGICPRIEASLKAAAPDGYELDVAGAHGFLTEKALVLEQAGFGLLLPAWWTRTGTKLRLTVYAHVKSPKLKGRSGLSLDEVVRFDWVVALGGEKLSLAELEALATLKAPLVRVRGQWVQVNADEIQAALAFWKRKAVGSATVHEIVQMALGAAKAPTTIAFNGVTAEGWIADLLAQLEGRATFAELPTPHKFLGTLRPYQLRGYSWLAFLRRWGLGACLADDMGLGKTIQTLALILRDWESQSKGPVLLICPTSVVGNWQREAARFTPSLPVMVHHGLARTRGAAFKKEAQKHAIVLSSYSLLHRDFEILKDVSWSGVILDEAQNIKNPETKQAGAARGLRAGYRVALTGTPVENNVGDLWSITEFLNPGFLGTQTEFKRTFFVPIQASRDSEAVSRLKRLTGPFILRRLKTDKTIIADLPEKMEMKVFCTLTKEQASLYAAVVKDASSALDSTDGIKRRGVILGTLSKLKQVCNHPAQFLGDNTAIPGRSGKLARLTEMLEEILEVGDRALIFSQFSEMGAILRRHLQETFGREVLFLHGAIPKTQRDRMVERFQTEADGPRLFILSLKAGGTGLNLTGANHVFHFDRWWNPAVENQATDRAFRIGQTRNVQVHKFLCIGTLEEKIDEMIDRKQEIAAGVVGTGEGWLTELSTAELKDLFALRKEAVGE
jgi:SNF2 family DNA or RNA helicase